MNKACLVILGVLLLTGCTTCNDDTYNETYSEWGPCIDFLQNRTATNSCEESINETQYCCVDDSYNELYSNWTYCEDNIQYRTATNICNESITESRDCNDITVDDIVLGMGDLPIGYAVLTIEEEESNISEVVGTIDGVNYTRADLGYKESTTSSYSYQSTEESFGIISVVSIYSDEGVKKRFTISKNDLDNESLNNEDTYQVSGQKIGDNSAVYAVRYLPEGAYFYNIQYMQFFYKDRYWVYTAIWGREGSVNAERLSEINEIILGKIDNLIAEEQK